MKAKKAKNYPKSGPTNSREITYTWARDNIKAKYVPREPREGETLVKIMRPQVGPFEFATFAAGDLINVGGKHVVVTAAKPGFTRVLHEDHGKQWEQILVIRPATAEDEEAVASQIAAARADIQRAMDRMMSS